MFSKYLLDITFLIKPFITSASSHTGSISAAGLREITLRTARGTKKIENVHLLPTCFHQNVPCRRALLPLAGLGPFAWGRIEYL